MGLLGVAATGHDRGFSRLIFCCCRLVDFDPSLTEP
jgi:hypothetical protein